jgi:hypothetical protein
MPDDSLQAVGGPSEQPEAWEDMVADRIEQVVAEVRRRTYSPLRSLAALIVFGVLVCAMAALGSVLVVLALTRLLSVYAFPHHVWAVYLCAAGIFGAAGLLLWSKRR